MLPEIFKDARGCIVAVIVALPPGRYGVSMRVNDGSYSEESRILYKSFDDLDEARYWVRANTLIEAVEAA